MKPDRLLVIDADGLEAWCHEHGRLEACAQFKAGGNEGLAAFRKWLGTQSHRSRFAILVDLAEERCALEHLPRANRADRKAMVLRKMRQHFPGTDFTTSEHQGKHEGNPALDTFMLCALTRPALFEPWFQALEQAAAVVTRLDTPPRLLAQWLRGSPFAQHTCLLLSLTASGMRQTLFRNGKVSFTRIAPQRAKSLAECLPFYISELSQTRAYLASQRLIADNTELKVLFLSHPDDRPILSRTTGQDRHIDIQFIDLPAQVHTQQRDAAGPDSDSRPFLLQSLMDRPPRIQYPAAPLKREYTVARLRYGLFRTAGSAAVVMLLAAGAVLLDARGLALQIQPLEAEQLALQRQIADITRQRPALPAPMAVTLDWLDDLEHARNAAIPTGYVLRRISTMLDATPALHLERLSWHAADAALSGRGAGAGGHTSAQTEGIAVEIDARIEPDITFAGDGPMEQSSRLVHDWQTSFNLEVQAKHLPAFDSAADEHARSVPGSSRVNLRFILPQAERSEGAQ
ncbi:MAG: hypothetical protein PHG21_02900 [Azoarcus sp.]|nr:hypothetical protein [Azoarcus sp.]